MKNYCGCCGNETKNDFWCDKCKDHVLTTGHLWDRTYEARYGRECPFRVSVGELEV